MQSQSLDTFLKQAAATVDAELDRLIPSEDTEPIRLHKAVRHSLFAGGKRFRPALLFAVGNALGAGQKNLSTTAAAIEMIHTYSLIHDDLPAMDDDDLRRGRPTCHKVFGEATAILAGDVLQTLAFQAIANDGNLSSEVRVRLIAELALAAGSPCGMVAGQQLDLEGEGKIVLDAGLEEIHGKKTGAMIVASAKAGAIIAGADESLLLAVQNYAALLGLLFQITDDLLDVTQSTAVLGKTAGKDATVEKATYPSLYGNERTRELSMEVHQKACDEIAKIPNNELLIAISDFVLNRIK